LILADTGSDWSLSGSVETFALPAGLFIVVALVLFFLYTRPHVVPGHRDLAAASPGGAPAPGGGTAAATGGTGKTPDAGDGA
jgi:hypothetical protein